MQDIEVVMKNGKRVARIKGSNLPDIPKPYSVILKTEVKNEYEVIWLTKDQYEKVLMELEKGSSGVILNGEYHDRYSIFKIRKPKGL